jgi:hypothetical protein
MWLILFRSLVLLALGWAGWHFDPISGRPVVGLAIGVLFALGIITLELRLRRVSGHGMVGALVGGVTGLIGARLVLGVMGGLDFVARDFVHSLLIVFRPHHRRLQGRLAPAPVQDPRHLGDHRRADCRHL